MESKQTLNTLERKKITNKEAEKKGHPQRDLMKKICNAIFYMGGGNFWYEDRNLTKLQQTFYNIYAVTLNLYIFGNYLNEILATLFRDVLTDKEKNDLIQFIIGHLHVLSKFVMCYMARERVKIFLKKILEGDREFAVWEIDLKSVKVAKRYCVILILSLTICLSSATIDGIMVHFKQGIPIRTEVVLYPTPADTGIVVNILRTMVEMHWWLLVALMTGVDCLVATSLVLVGYKFRTLAAYFGSLRQKYLQRSGENLDVLEKDFRKDFIAGIKFHKEILWIQRYLQYALGSTYSIQITESLLLLSITMIKMVALERNSTNLIANFSYISCVIALTGAYMLSGGNIMIEAEKIPKAIFYSGWEFTRSGKRLRSLIVVTIIRSQVPVFMTAFGIIMLSHNNFILILKNSYSFFAVMY